MECIHISLAGVVEYTTMPVKILVVDDEPLILTAVERALTRVGYEVSRACSRKDLDDCLKSAPFDLLITDVYMEEDSVEQIISRVRASSPGVKVLKMSGSVNKEQCANFIEKPFSIESLRKRVREILDEPS